MATDHSTRPLTHLRVSEKQHTYSEVTEEQYESEVRGSLARREFDKLETEATLARQGGRTGGGTWRLLIFYIAVGS